MARTNGATILYSRFANSESRPDYPPYRQQREHGDNSRSEEHTSELQSLRHLVCRLLFERIRPPPTSTLFPYTTLFRSILYSRFANSESRPDYPPYRQQREHGDNS